MNDSNPNSGPDEHSDSSIEYPKLSEALKALSKPRMKIPASVDVAIRAEARKKLGRVVPLPSPPPTRIRWWIPVGVAASLVLLVWVGQRPDSHPAPATALRGDLDGSGEVDMVDALILARKLQQGGRLDPSEDMNGDGVVDALDLKVVTQTAVLLERQGGI